MKFNLNGAREKQVFHVKHNNKVERFTLEKGELPIYAFEYAKKKFGIKEIKPKLKKGAE